MAESLCALKKLPVVKVTRVADLKKKIISLATPGEVEHYGKIKKEKKHDER